MTATNDYCNDDPYETFYLDQQENQPAANTVCEDHASLIYERSLQPEKYPVLAPIAKNPNALNGKRSNASDASEDMKRKRP
ncbi:Protein of unknown function (DUF5137) [Nakaseomyces glabratus]